MSNTRSEQSTRADMWRTLEVELDPNGRIVDFLNPTLTRTDGPEERVRQHYARILVEEYGYKKETIAFEAPINIGREVKFADIAIFKSPEAATDKIQGQIELVVETKAPDETSGVGQLTSYIFASSASGGVWFNLNAAYFRRVEHPKLELRLWTNIPRLGETWDSVGNYKKSDLRRPVDLKRVFRRCHNAIYRSGMDSEDIALDMVRMILAKYRDEQNVGEVCDFRCTPDEFQSSHGRGTVRGRVVELFKQAKEDHPDVFPASEQISIKADNVATIVSELQGFRFISDDDSEQVYDVIGTAFEVYVAAHLKGGRGQYFTNRLVVNMMVHMMDPSERDIIYDPACRSGGFLIACLRFVRERILISNRPNSAKQREIRSAAGRLFGSDIAPKLVRVAKTNMVLNGDGHGGIVQANALNDLDSQLPEQYPARSDTDQNRRPTLILMNPPFGASYDLRERGRRTLEQFDLGHIWAEDDTGRLVQSNSLNSSEGIPPEILFLERAISILAPGGRMAVVLARGVLDNRDALAAREFVLNHCRLRGVVNCHPNTFAPFNGTKASVLLLQKKTKPGTLAGEDYPVFMAISQKVGQDSMGREIHKRNAFGELILEHGSPVIDHDLGSILDAWHGTNLGQTSQYESAWTVPLSRIIKDSEKRMNPIRYAPKAEKALGYVLELADTDGWKVERLGDFASVFNGPRFKRPFASDGVRSGSGIVPMFTPRAFFEEKGESLKYLDLNKASRTQTRQLEILRLEADWILIVESGTAGKLLGKIGITSKLHDGSIGNNNMIRVIIADATRRDYVYRFLSSILGQTLLLRNVYGTNQDHIEPDDVKNIPIPIPVDDRLTQNLHLKVREIIDLRNRFITPEPVA